MTINWQSLNDSGILGQDYRILKRFIGHHQSANFLYDYGSFHQDHRIIQGLPTNHTPAGIWCQNDVVLTSMRRTHVASTLIRRHFRTKCPLGMWFAHRITSWVVHLPYRLKWVGLITASDQTLWGVHSCNSWLWCYIYLCPTTNLQNFVNIYYVPTCLSY